MPSFISGKKLILLGFIVVLLVAIPLTVYLVQQQQKTKSSAVAATILTFVPSEKTVNVNDNFNLDVNVDPGGVNQVSFVKLNITYDPTKIATSSSGITLGSWTAIDGSKFTPSILQGPTYGNGEISVTISVGSSPQNVIQKPTVIATIGFTAISPTDPTYTQVQFGNQTQVLSIGSTDQFNENVLSSAPPAKITINASSAPTPTNTPTPTPTVVITPTDTPTPTGSTIIPTNTPTPTPAQQATSNSPVCSSLTIDKSSSGTTPYNVNLTVTGSSGNSTISKVSFNFGDGQTQDITNTGGIGTNSVSVLQSHIYNSAGTFTTTATLTDANGLVSNIGNCSLVMTISSQIAQNPTPIPSPAPLPPTGPTQIVTVGTIGAVITIIGAVLLFSL